MLWRAATIVTGLSLMTGCAALATSMAASAISGSGATFATDDDPDLVREAAPFALKSIESLLNSSPEDRGLLLAATSGFTQYAYGFLLFEAQKHEEDNPAAARHLYKRCRRLLARARAYGMRGLEVEHEEFTALLAQDRTAAVALLTPEDVPLLYWTAAAWAGQISISKADMFLVGQLPQVEALMKRALELDETFDHGAIHEFFVAYDGGRSEAMGGSRDQAREHRDRALELSAGQKLGPWVTWAETVTVQAQNREEFLRILEQVLAFELSTAPQFKLVNALAQDKAQWLVEHADDLFL